MKKLTLHKVEQVDELAWPENFQEINLQSPAILALTDFKKHKPLIIEENMSAHDAENLMMRAHVRLKIVVDSNNKFLGVVSLADIHHQEIMRKVANGYEHDELLVTDFMQAKADLMAIDFIELKRATVSDILETLKTNGQRHCLVINREKHNIRGVVSASDLVRMLKLKAKVNFPPSFVEIFNEVHA